MAECCRTIIDDNVNECSIHTRLRERQVLYSPGAIRLQSWMKMLKPGKIPANKNQMRQFAVRFLKRGDDIPLSSTISNVQVAGTLGSSHVSAGTNRRPFAASDSPPGIACSPGP